MDVVVISMVIVAPVRSAPGMAIVPVNSLNPPVCRPLALLPMNSIFDVVEAIFISAAEAKPARAQARTVTVRAFRISESPEKGRIFEFVLRAIAARGDQSRVS